MRQIFIRRNEISLLILFIILGKGAYSQIRLGPTSGTADGSAALEVKSGPFTSGSAYRGFLTPTVTTAQRNQIQSPATGLMVYNTSTNQIEVNIGTAAAPAWTAGGAAGSGGNAWNLTGNTGTTNGNFLGTIDNTALYFRVNNQNSGRIDPVQNNSALGYLAYRIGSTGTGNTAMGTLALGSNTSGDYNIAFGLQALQNNTTGTANTAIGTVAMLANTTGQNNTASGYRALAANTIGGGNTALGSVALEKNTSGENNTALGTVALQDNSTGLNNTAVGAGALQNNTTGYENSAIGSNSQAMNTSGHSNIAVGTDALYANTIGNDNAAFGGSALLASTTGNGNLASGTLSLRNNTTGNSNSAAGYQALQYNTTGSFNSALGYNAGPSSSAGNLTNSTAIGANATFTASNQIVLGDGNITSLRCNVTSISSLSDKRIKKDIQANIPGLSFITRLTPVTYHISKLEEAKLLGYSLNQVQEDRVLHSGFLAQDVETAAKEVGYDFEGVHREEGGNYYTLGYTLFVIPLVQAVKELNTEIKRLNEKMDEGERAYNQLANQVKQMQELLGIYHSETRATASKK